MTFVDRDYSRSIVCMCRQPVAAAWIAIICVLWDPRLRPVVFDIQQEIPRHLKAEPATGHARDNLQQIRRDPLVEPFDALLRQDDLNGIEE